MRANAAGARSSPRSRASSSWPARRRPRAPRWSEPARPPSPRDAAEVANDVDGRIFPPRCGGNGRRWQTKRTFIGGAAHSSASTRLAPGRRRRCGSTARSLSARADDRCNPPGSPRETDEALTVSQLNTPRFFDRLARQHQPDHGASSCLNQRDRRAEAALPAIEDPPAARHGARAS